MPPRKAAKASASAPRSSSKRSAPSPKQPTRQSKRVKATPKKSSYFESDSESKAGAPASPSPGGTEEYGAAGSMDDASSNSNDSNGDDGVSSINSEEEDYEEVKPTKKTQRGRPAARKKKSTTTLPQRGKKKGVAKVGEEDADSEEEELWKPGATLPSDTQIIIKKPKARDAGPTPYTDETIHPNTLLFLQDLAANNDRKWFKSKYSNLLNYRIRSLAYYREKKIHKHGW